MGKIVEPHPKCSMFFTDTNGELPISCSTALYILGIVMQTKPLNEIDFDAFRALGPELDKEFGSFNR